MDLVRVGTGIATIGQSAVMKPACEKVVGFVRVAQLEKVAVISGRPCEKKQLMKAQLLLLMDDASFVLPMKMQCVTFIDP